MLMVSSLWWMNTMVEKETCFLPIFSSMLVDLYWDKKWNSDAFDVNQGLGDTPCSLALIKDISNLWDKIVATSGLNLMEGGERGSVSCLHSYCMTSLHTTKDCQCSVIKCNECHAVLKCNKCHMLQGAGPRMPMQDNCLHSCSEFWLWGHLWGQK